MRGKASTVALAVVLAVADALLLAANVAHLRVDERGREPLTFFSPSRWSGALDGSYVETLGHAQLAAAVVVLALVAARCRSVVLAVWTLVLGVVLADDARQLHERGGAALVRALDLPAVAGLRAADLGELTFWALSGTTLGALLLATHRRARGAERRQSWALARLLAVLAFFAVIVDMLHIAVAGRVAGPVEATVGLLETAGELGVMTAVLLAVVRSATRVGAPGAGERGCWRRMS